MPSFNGSGIPEDQIENYNEYQEILKSLTCCICLDIVKNPVECTTCESLYCDECWNLMKISGKKCVLHCTTPVIKANSFVYEILGKLKIKCETCGKGGISYPKYIKHAESCIMSKKYGTVSELSKKLKEKEDKIAGLKRKLDDLKNNSFSAKSYAVVENLTKEQIRQRLVTFNLNVNQKMELYSAAVEGRLNDFKNLVLNKHYPPLEEVSAHSYYWTPLHYALHYGKWEVAFFIFDYLKEKGEFENAMKLQSSDNRCPILCLLKSNALQYEQKKTILEKILEKYNFEITPVIGLEMRNRNFESLLKKYKKNVNY